MRPTSLQRWLFEVINLLLVVTFAIPLAVVISRLLYVRVPWIHWLLCLMAVGYLAGRLTLHSPAAVSQFACFGTAIAMTVVCGLLLHFFGGGLGAQVLGSFVFMLATAVGSLAFFFCARKAGYTIYAPMALVGVILNLAALLIVNGGDTPESTRTICSWAAVIFMLLSLYAFNARGLRKSVYTAENTRTTRLPKGIQGSSFLLVSGFIVLAGVISLLSPLFPVVGWLVGSGIRWIIVGFNRLISIFDKKDSPVPMAQDVVWGSPMEDIKLPFDDVVKEHAGWVSTLVNTFAILVIIVLMFFVLRYWYKKFLKGTKFFQALLGRMRDMFNPEDDEDYIDETENLFTWKKALDSVTGGFRNVMQKLTDRPQSFDDFKDDRLKIRFVYQQLLKRRQEESGGSSSQYETPNELREHLPDTTDTFIHAYNDVRYADAMPDAAQVANAKTLLAKK